MSSTITLRLVTASTVRAVTNLRVSSDQETYVASNAVSIAQAYFEPKAWFRAIYHEVELAGFVMLRDSTIVNDESSAPHELSLWRFMIDYRFQGSGVGREALAQVIEHAKTRRLVDQLVTSYVTGPHSPLGFYLNSGFVATGEVKENGEHVLLLPLK